jgi:hypothetical protein
MYHDRHAFSTSSSPLGTLAQKISQSQTALRESLMQYFYPGPDATPNEAALLNDLESLWVLGASLFKQQMGELFDAQRMVVRVWIEMRRTTIQILRHSMENERGVPISKIVDHLLIMNDLRILRLRWKTMNTQNGNQVLSSDDLLCRTLEVLTNTVGENNPFKEGLDRLNESTLGYLRTNDMKITMTR